MLITNGTIIQSGMRRRTVQRQVSFGPISLRIVTIVIIGAAVLMALMQSAGAATKAYRVIELQQQKTQKENDLEMTNADVARLRALNNNSALTDSATSPSPAVSPPPESKLVAPAKIDALPSEETSNLSQLPTQSRLP